MKHDKHMDSELAQYEADKAKAARKKALKGFRKACEKKRDLDRSVAREGVRGQKTSFADSVVAEAENIDETVAGSDE